MYKIQPKSLFTGKNTIYLPTCHSTNETAAEIIQKEEISEGTIIITDHQTKGKGQRNNGWFSNKGENLTFTLILRPHFLPIAEQFKLNIAVSLAIHKTFSAYLDDKLKIKWPNDILYGNKKLAGILIENMLVGGKMDYTFIGLGLNINQRVFDMPQASSLSSQTEGVQYQLSQLLTEFSVNMETEYLALQKGFDEKQKVRFLKELFQMNEWSKYSTSNEEFEGKIVGVNTIGQLLMETTKGLRTFGNKEFTYLY